MKINKKNILFLIIIILLFSLLFYLGDNSKAELYEIF